VTAESLAQAAVPPSGRTFEESVLEGFSDYLGLTLEDIAKSLGYRRPSKGYKGFHREVARRILLGGSIGISELELEDVEMKSIRVNKDWKPNEAMSFPNFKYLEIVKERWEDSKFCEKLERRFLFVVFRTDEQDVERLAKVFYWNMSYRDRQEARRVWLQTKKCVAKDARYLPTSRESYVAHVRPKARNSRDTELTPQGLRLVKKCFWLNREYIASILEDA
jgi:DNA mismatch repair protein MutH